MLQNRRFRDPRVTKALNEKLNKGAEILRKKARVVKPTEQKISVPVVPPPPTDILGDAGTNG